MISASAAESHRFGRVKRNGYDPTEVDAVVSRLIDTLNKYEARTERLEEKLAEADTSSEAMRRMFITAEQTRDQMILEAREESDRILAEARATTEQLREEAAGLDAELAEKSERVLRDAEEAADQIRTEAELAASERITRASQEAEALLGAATSDASAMTHEANAARRAAAVASAWLTREAKAQAKATIDEATATAAVILRDAEVESEALRTRVVALRNAVTSLQTAAADLALMTAEEGSVIDLKAIEALGADTEPPISTDRESEPLLSVAEAREALEHEAVADGDTDEDDVDEEAGSTTFYQRSTGTPLSERIKIARMSH